MEAGLGPNEGCSAKGKKKVLYIFMPLLGGLFVTTAWRVLRLRMEETASKYGGYLRIYLISSLGQSTRGGPPAWGLGVRLIIPHHKNKLVNATKDLGPGRIPKLRKMNMRFVTWNGPQRDKMEWYGLD
jgi:hypothetical protein